MGVIRKMKVASEISDLKELKFIMEIFQVNNRVKELAQEA